MNRGTKNKNQKILNKDYRKKKIERVYISKEIKNLIRNPIFFMQCVIPPFLFPLVFLIPMVITVLNQEEGKIVIEYLSQYINSSVGLIVCLEIICLFYIFNFATITSISRDGSDAKVMKYLPIDLNKQLIYKSFLGVLFNLVPLVYIVVILCIMFRIKTTILAEFIILSILINIFNNFLVIIVDLKNPKIDWMTEYAVVKQNLNMFYQMLIIVTQMGILFIFSKIKNINICFTILSLIFIILIILIRKYTNKNKSKLFRKIY